MFKKKTKLTLNFKSGISIDIKCDEYNFTHKTESCEFIGYKITGMKPFVSFQPSRLESFVVRK